MRERDKSEKPKRWCLSFSSPKGERKVRRVGACLSGEKVRAQMAQETAALFLCFLDTSPAMQTLKTGAAG